MSKSMMLTTSSRAPAATACRISSVPLPGKPTVVIGIVSETIRFGLFCSRILIAPKRTAVFESSAVFS